MNRITPFILLLLFLLTPGCVSTFYRFGNENIHPYRATSDVFQDCICVWSKHPTYPEEQLLKIYIEFTYLFWLVDFPFEIVSDTICLPYDAFKAIP